MTQELKIQDAVNDENPITKCLTTKLKVFTFIVITLHTIIATYYDLSSGANSLISKSVYFSFKTLTGHITLNISGVYKISFKHSF